jgi:galactose mutarotase-like enzyme
MEWSANVEHVVVYTPPHALCIEPQTCAIDAFNLASRGAANAGLRIVDEDHPLEASSMWRWRAGDAGS